MLKKILSIVFFSYCVLASLFIAVSGAFTIRSHQSVVFQILFLPLVAYFIIEILLQLRGGFSEKNWSFLFSKRRMIASVIIFLVFVFGGILKITIAVKKTDTTNPEPDKTALIYNKSTSPSPFGNPEPKRLEIVINDGSPAVNIRKSATLYSPIVAETKVKDIFELVKKEGQWYEIKLNENETGYIFENYIKIIEETKP